MESVEMSDKGEYVMSTIEEDFVSNDVTTTGEKGQSEKPFSAFELLSHREILRQGIQYISKFCPHQLIPDINHELAIQGKNDQSETIDDSVLMPPPKPKQKPKSHFTLEESSLAAKIKKMKKHKKHKRSSRKEAERSRVTKRKRETVDAASVEGALVPTSVVPEMEGRMTVDLPQSHPNLSPVVDKINAHAPAGLRLFLELINRCTNEQKPNQLTKGDNNEDETTAECDILKNVVAGYEEKSRQYTKNARCVQNLTSQEVLHYYLAIREELKDIFNGIRTSARHALYLEGWDFSKLKVDTLNKEKELKELNLSIPFSGEHTFVLIDSLNEYLVCKEDAWQFGKYIAYVMIPEAFIRIYARMTGQTYKNAELEMMFGACYEEDHCH